MAQVMAWLFADGSSSVADRDGKSQDLSVSSMQARTQCDVITRTALLLQSLELRSTAQYDAFGCRLRLKQAVHERQHGSS